MPVIVSVAIVMSGAMREVELLMVAPEGSGCLVEVKMSATAICPTPSRTAWVQTLWIKGVGIERQHIRQVDCSGKCVHAARFDGWLHIRRI